MMNEAKSLSGFLVFVLIPASILNMYLYWSSFNINPFMFIGSSDLFSIAVPFALQAGAILFGVYLSIFLFPPESSTHPDQRSLKKYVIPIWMASLAFSVIAFLYSEKLGHNITMMVFMGVLGTNAVFFKYILRLKEWKLNFSTQFSIRTAAFTSVYTPLLAIFLAYTSSHDITANKSFTYICSSDLVANEKFPDGTKLPFLGKLGTTYILATPDFREKIFLEPSGFKIMNFRTYETK